jgi:hypothetical protein
MTPLQRAAILSGSALKPTWFWDFASRGVLPPNATFTRATTASYFNSAGVLSTASSGSARFDYDPVTGSPLGYLSEMASTNLCIRSQELDNASWGKTRATVTADAVASPDGTTNADKIVEDSSTNSHYANSATIALTNVPVTISAFVKSAGRTACRFEFAGGAGTFGAHFNLATGAVHSVDASTTATIRNVGGGWYRIGVQATWPSSSNCNIFIYPANPAGTTSYTGDGTSGIYAWGVQCESGGVGVTSYIPTAGSTVTRNQDVLSLPLTSLPGWSATQGGVLVAAYRLHTLRPGLSQGVVSFSDVGENNIVSAIPWYAGSSSGRIYMYSGGVLQSSVTSISPAGTSTPFARGKMAAGWGTSRGQGSFDGGSTGTVSGSYSLPASPTNLYIGADGVSGGRLNGTLESIAYYRGARSDAFVQAVSR